MSSAICHIMGAAAIAIVSTIASAQVIPPNAQPGREHERFQEPQVPQVQPGAPVISLPSTASTMASFASGTSPDVNASCRIPFETLKDSKTGESFPLSAALNESAKLSDNLRQRYIVADLNSADESGNCRGVQEYFSPVGELSEFPRLQAIATALKMDVASLAKQSLDSLLESEVTPDDASGLELEL